MGDVFPSVLVPELLLQPTKASDMLSDTPKPTFLIDFFLIAVRYPSSLLFEMYDRSDIILYKLAFVKHTKYY